MPDQDRSDQRPEQPERPGRGRRWKPNDDLLTGFDRTGRSSTLRVFFAITIGSSLLVWEVTFDLGAYHTVFYYRLFQILVISSVLLLGSIVLRHDVLVRPWTRLVLAIPLIWVLNRLISPFGRSSDAAHILDDTLIAGTVAGLPFILWAVARVMAPDFFALPDRRLKVAVVTIVALVAVAGFLVGQFNYEFTTCQNYIISGDDTPANCRTEPSPPPSPSMSPRPSPSPSPMTSPSPLASPS